MSDSKDDKNEPPDPATCDVLAYAEQLLKAEQARHERLLEDLGNVLGGMLQGDPHTSESSE